MHTKALAALFGLSLAACTGVIEGPGGGGGGDDTGGEGCGDGVTQGGEACDDGNTLSGDGCSASCSTEEVITPRVTATVDKVTVSTELGKTEQLTVNLTSVDGFAGPVNLASIVDYGAGTAGTWTVTQSKPTATLAAGGTDSVTIEVQIPTDSVALTGTVKVDATSTAVPVNLSSTVNVANQYTIVMPAGTGTSIPHAYLNNSPTIRLREGSKVRFKNDDTMAHRIHGDGDAMAGVPHEIAGGGQPGGTYEVTLAPGNGTWYCHEHNENGQRTYNIQVVEQ